jgi:hypothetical protein
MLSLLQCVLAVAVAAPVSSAPTPGLSPMRHVRSTSDYVEQLLATGSARSYTFRSLVHRLERSDVIVYVEPVSGLPPHLQGRLLLMGIGRGTRFLRVEFQRNQSSNESIALIAHELQHAMEVADAPDVQDTATFARLYKRIGHHGAIEGEYDTWAALDAGRAVWKELNA